MSNKKVYIIYKATHLPSKKVYIGLTGDLLMRRIGQHMSVTSGVPTPFQLVLMSSRYEDWTWEILYTISDKSEAFKVEADAIADMLKDGIELFNVAGAGREYRDPSSWLSAHQFKKGQKAHNSGKLGVSEATSAKMRIAKLRNPVSNPPTPETINYIKEKYGKRVICNDTGIVYKSVGEAARAIGSANSGVRNSCKTGSLVKGYSFSYVLDSTTP